MFYPTLFKDDLFDDFFDFPTFRDFDKVDRKLYGKHANGLMKTDVRENEGNYELDIDLPGFKKDEISLTLDNGYLIVGAAKTVNEDEKDSKGKMLRQERYSGAMQRSFYVGDGIDENDVKAKFEDGVLSLSFPKVKEPEIPEKKTIMIEG
ncbi:MAG: Hsp20/alpha crystallin family protein [Mogibacterium sp.]|nr:Hsp20/alpha crystallin family protein [Mogibacterium sp.]